MSIWYRAAQTENIENVFSGSGGLYVAGRWNYKGRKAIYCSQSIALCTLEWLSHNGLSVSGYSYYRFSIEIPDELIIQLSLFDLPKEWNLTPAVHQTRNYAEKILFNENKFIAMAVPSIIVPEESNLIINPSHHFFSALLKTTRAMGQYIAPHRV
jgi:RES domain-containing protein